MGGNGVVAAAPGARCVRGSGMRVFLLCALPFHDHGQQTDGRAGSAWRVCGRRRDGDAGGGERGERERGGELPNWEAEWVAAAWASERLQKSGGGFTAFNEEEKERDGGRTRRAPLPRRARAPFPSSSPQCDCVRRQRPRPASSSSAATLSRPIGSDERNTPSFAYSLTQETSIVHNIT